LRLFAAPAELAEWDRRYRAGGMGYGEAKKRVAELFEGKFAPARERRGMLASDATHVEDVLAAGGRKARAVARSVMERARDACGIVVAKS
jgi:tryptophanyl-tRNA synthetase